MHSVLELQRELWHSKMARFGTFEKRPPGEAWNNYNGDGDNDDDEADGSGKGYSPVVSSFTDLSLQLIRIIFW